MKEQGSWKSARQQLLAENRKSKADPPESQRADWKKRRIDWLFSPTALAVLSDTPQLNDR